MMKIVKLRITGVGAILMHNPASMRSADPAALQRGGKKIPAPIDEATAGLYALPDGRLYIKSEAFREAGLIAAGDVRDTSRKGRATMTRRFASSVFLSSEYFPLYRASNDNKPITSSTKDWEIDIRRVVVQKNGVMRARPKITDWGCLAEFEYDDEIIDETMIAEIQKSAGKYPGVLDYRVGKKGPFGRFQCELLTAAPTKKSRKLAETV